MRLAFTGFVAFAIVPLALAQNPSFWPEGRPKSNAQPALPRTAEPRLLPTPYTQAQPLLSASPLIAPSKTVDPMLPKQSLMPGEIGPDATVKLAQPERIAKIDSGAIGLRRSADRWEVLSDRTVLRDFGTDEAAATEFAKVLRDLRPTQWGSIGTGRTIVEYALVKDHSTSPERAAKPAFSPKTFVAIDPATVRVESLRGVWVLRDDANILLNFGKASEDAEQALNVIKKYGFNRLGQIGPVSGGVTYFFAQDAAPSRTQQAPSSLAALQAQYQEQQLTRTGIEMPGKVTVGERIPLDPKTLEVRREKSDWILAQGTEILCNFGSSEWSAKDALKLVQQQRFSEFCRFNKDVTFFLVQGAAPTKVPFSVQSSRFDNAALKVRRTTGEKYAIYEGVVRQLFVCDTEKEALQLLEVLQHYGFDNKCQLGLSSANSLHFLAKTSR